MKKVIILCLMFIVLVSCNSSSEATSTVSKNLKIVLDAGHGGKDSGAEYGTIKESPINLKITLDLKRQLEKRGYEVILTRVDDNDLASNKATNRKRDDLANRVKIVKQNDPIIFISVHMNKYANTSVKGSNVFYSKNNVLSYSLANNINESMKLKNKTHFLVRVGDYYLLNNIDIPAVLIEYGFISNSRDMHYYRDDDYISSINEKVVDGIDIFINNILF